ncbi:MAG: sigma-70 family RNA polymerase sigma factor [Clostridia bacterium]|nr:sigma-70 family RNA polymerase sigma factor [Clostridia bacterium]
MSHNSDDHNTDNKEIYEPEIYEPEIYELVEKIKNGEENAMVHLLRRYEPLIGGKVSEFVNSLEADDIRQMCAIGLFEAAQSFSEERAGGKVTFGLYAKLCIRNRILSEIRKSAPLEKHIEKDIFTDVSIMEDDVINRYALESALTEARKKLTPYEDKVLRLYLKTGSYDEVAAALGKTRKSVDNAMSRIRSKFRNLL